MGNLLDLGTINAHDRRVSADDWSGRAQMGSRWIDSAPLPSVSAVVENERRAQRPRVAMRASVMRIRVAASNEPRTVPAIFE